MKLPTSPAGTRDVQGPHGFTLLELLVVMAILALAAAAIGPRVPGVLDGAQARAAIGGFQAALQDARRDAMRSGQTRRFLIDAAGARYGMDGGRTTALPRGAQLSLRTAGQAGSDLPGGQAAILFFPDGSSSGGRIRLQLHGQVLSLEVDWLSGLVRPVTEAGA